MSFWTDKTVLVTGAAGFVGSALTADLLSQGAKVIAVDLEGVRSRIDCDPDDGVVHVSRTDIRNRDAVARLFDQFEIEVVYHLAAESNVGDVDDDPVRGFESNVQGTWNVLEAVRNDSSDDASVVVASSDKAYGPHEELPYTESSELKPESPYAVSKMAADRLAYSYAISYGLSVTIARCSNIYGPGDRNFSRLIPATIRDCLAGDPPVIRSDGQPTRDYLYIEDAVDAYRTLGEQTRSYAGEAFNFGTGVETTVLDVVSRIASTVGNEDIRPVVLDEADGEISHQSVDSTKANRLLDWQPETSLDDGIERTVPWYRANVETS